MLTFWFSKKWEKFLRFFFIQKAHTSKCVAYFFYCCDVLFIFRQIKWKLLWMDSFEAFLHSTMNYGNDKNLPFLSDVFGWENARFEKRLLVLAIVVFLVWFYRAFGFFACNSFQVKPKFLFKQCRFLHP